MELTELERTSAAVWRKLAQEQRERLTWDKHAVASAVNARIATYEATAHRIEHRIEVGRTVLDPLNRHVVVIEMDKTDKTGCTAKVRLAGSYGATVAYPVTTLRRIETGC